MRPSRVGIPAGQNSDAGGAKIVCAEIDWDFRNSERQIGAPISRQHVPGIQFLIGFAPLCYEFMCSRAETFAAGDRKPRSQLESSRL
jgi:hypothetical protein